MNDSIKAITASILTVVQPVASQLLDAATEIAHASVSTVSLAAGSTLVLATATRMSIEGAAALTPSTKEEAELLITTAMASMFADTTEPQEGEPTAATSK